jgi:voltage-gated potassium channel
VSARLADRPLLRRAIVPTGAFGTVVVAGISGFTVLADVSVVDAAFWLLDPTSLEVHFSTHEGPERLTKAYALLVFTGLVLTSLWTGETVLTAAFGERINTELRHVQTKRKIDDLEDHVVVCGHGMFGRTVAARMCNLGRDVVVIERNETALERAPDGVVTLVGDARQEETLRDAGIERAGALVAAIDDSNANIQITIVTSQLAPSCRLVTRVGDEVYEATARRAGADEVIIPEVLSGNEVSDLL